MNNPKSKLERFIRLINKIEAILRRLNIIGLEGYKKRNKRKTSREIEHFVWEIANKLNDQRSIRFYIKTIKLVPERVIFETLRQIRAIEASGVKIKNKGALFNILIYGKAKGFGENLRRRYY